MKTPDTKDPIEPKIKLRRTKRTVRHDFDDTEKAKLHQEFHQAAKEAGAAEMEMKAVAATYKGKVETAKSKAGTLSATIDAGFELREKPVAFLLNVKNKRRLFYLEDQIEVKKDAEVIKKDAKPVVDEPATEQDFQNELLEAEQKFELRDEVPLFPPTGSDKGALIVGRLKEKWFSALRVKIGSRAIEERLDSEQPCVKNRPDAVKKALDRFKEWLKESIGKDTADGFGAVLDTVWEAHKERVE